MKPNWKTFSTQLPKLGDDIEIDAESWDGGKIIHVGKVTSEPRRPKSSDTIVTDRSHNDVWLLDCERAVGAMVKAHYKWRKIKKVLQ